MNYYKRHIGDYAAKAGHLSALEHGVYTLLIDAYYNREEGPTRAEAIRIARARTPEELAAVEIVLGEFFTEADGRFLQSRIEDELAAFRIKQEVNRELGARGGKANAKRIATETLSEAEAYEVANDKPSHKPVANNHKEQKQKKEQGASPNGSRLPLDWTLPTDWLTWAIAERPELNAKTEADRFRDYWHGVAGAKGRKADWLATWRNWIRNARGGPPPSPAKHSAAADFRGKTYDATPIDQLPPDLRDAARAALADG